MSAQPENRNPTLTRHDLAIALAIALAVATFHFINGRALSNSVLLQSFNWLFDFDSSRFVGGWCTPGADVARDMGVSFVARHALSLATRPPCLALTALIGDPNVALMALTALCAGVAAGIAYWLAAAFCEHAIDRTLLAIAFAVSAQPLLLGVIPETYGFALAGIGLHLALVAHGRAAPPATGWSAVVSFGINAGVTVTNAGLNIISSMALAWKRLTLNQWLRGQFRVWVIAAVVLAAIVVPLAALFTPTALSAAGTAPKQVWWIININRGEAAGLARVVTTFFAYDFVAPMLTVVNLPAPDSHPMLDFRTFGYGLAGSLALAIWTLAMLAGVVYATGEDGARRLLATVALWMLANIVLHWYWQYRGSIYLYGAHTAFPLFAILAMGYGGALRRHSHALVRGAAIALIVLSAVNNLQIYRQMIDFVVAQPPQKQHEGPPILN